MATELQLQEVRVNTQEPDNTEPFTDDFITALIDAHGQTEAEHRIWIAKRNAVSAIVDISEGGSSRKNSQLFEHYSKIVLGYETEEVVAAQGARSPMTRAITRV